MFYPLLPATHTEYLKSAVIMAPVRSVRLADTWMEIKAENTPTQTHTHTHKLNSTQQFIKKIMEILTISSTKKMSKVHFGRT